MTTFEEAEAEQELNERKETKTLDMITQVELADALKTREKVDRRVQEVALFVANLRNEFAGVESPDWKVRRWDVFPSPTYGEEMCKVTLEVLWRNRPVTDKFGDPKEDEDCYAPDSAYLTRHVTFPARYLTSEGWQQEEEKKAATAAAHMLTIHLEDMGRAIVESKKHTEVLEKNRVEMEARIVKLREKGWG